MVRYKKLIYLSGLLPCTVPILTPAAGFPVGSAMYVTFFVTLIIIARIASRTRFLNSYSQPTRESHAIVHCFSFI